MIEEVQPTQVERTVDDGKILIGAFLHMVLSYADQNGISVALTASCQCGDQAIGNASFVGNVDHLGPGVVNLLKSMQDFAKQAEEENPTILLPNKGLITL